MQLSTSLRTWLLLWLLLSQARADLKVKVQPDAEHVPDASIHEYDAKTRPPAVVEATAQPHQYQADEFFDSSSSSSSSNLSHAKHAHEAGDEKESVETTAQSAMGREARQVSSDTEQPESSSSSTTINNSPPTEDNPTLGGGKSPGGVKQQRLWGAPAPLDDDEHYAGAASNPPKEETHKDDSETINTVTATTTTTSSSSHSHHPNLHIPFVPPKSSHPPPPGFTISARVYIDPKDKLGHIDEEPLTLPYWDCGAVGSTTSPLRVTEATFRHCLTPSQGWSGTDGKHPLLAIALSEFLLETSSGATKVIQAGQAVLLEDVLVKGHKIRPIHHHDARVLFLTLPNTHYKTGKDQISIPRTIVKTNNDPCPIDDDEATTGTANTMVHEFISSNRIERDTRIRRIFFGIVGLSLSTILADFLGKTAPLWLAVGVGGTFFVVTGTVGVIALGEAAVSNVQAYLQTRRLRVSEDDAPSL